MYKCICAFSDKADRYHVYKPGDTYPRPGAEPTPERLAELSGWGNALRMPLIKEDAPTGAEKPRRGRPPKREAVIADDDGNMRTAK